MVRPRPDALAAGGGSRAGRAIAYGRTTAASPDEPSRLAEGVAQPASSLRVQNMSALCVCQCGTRCAERDLRRDLPATCRRHALSCSAMHEDGTNGTPRVPHECRNHAEAVILVYWSISYTQLVGCYTFVGHAGGTTSTSPIQSFARMDQSATLELESLGRPNSL